MIANALKSSDGNINYPGLIAAWSAKGKSNDDADRAILKDLTGNGHDITLNGFAFSKMSGYGGYNHLAFTIPWKIGDINYIDIFRNINYFTLTFSKIINNAFIWYNNFLFNGNALKLKVSGLSEKVAIYVNYGDNKQNLINGENIILFDDLDNTLLYFATSTLFENANVRVELLPEYPDALVFDGVDDYGVNEDMPILTDYTIIAERELFEIQGVSDKGFISYSKGLSSGRLGDLFGLETFYNNKFWAVSFASQTKIDVNKNKSVVYQNKLNYNGIIINSGTISNIDVYKMLRLGRNTHSYIPFAFYSAYLFDRSLDEQEIKAFIRKYIDPEYLLPSEEIPTPDCYYDFSQGSNDDTDRNTIKDYSGNGNDAVAHNFGWNENSGYGGCANFVQWNNVRNNYIGSITSNKIYISKSKTDSKPILYSPSIRSLMKFKVEGLLQNQSIRFGSDINNSTLLEVTQDGIYEVDWNKSTSTRCIIPTFIGECDITIELLPEYPGALVFDGVDDYVSLDAFDSGFKTMFMVCNPRNKSNAFLYEQRKNTELPYDYGLYTYNSVAYNIRNANATYINGIKNTKVFTKDLNNKKILISVNSKLTQLNKPTISVGITGSYSDMALYKFLGFKEALTEEQIQTVIKKYNLLDGVDEIEVS